jgi:replication-associated recombination protein RarA
VQLHEKYRPKTIEGFIGLERPKKILRSLVARPMPIALLFVGRSGRGKTAMAYALASDIGAQLHLCSAHECTRENIDSLWSTCRRPPSKGSKWHMVLVDQADGLIKTHQIDLRSKLDGPNKLANLIWVFAAESAEKLDEGFRSRCLTIHFSNHGQAPALARHLEGIWQSERPDPGLEQPNFARVVKEANGNLRTALNHLQRKLD